MSAATLNLHMMNHMYQNNLSGERILKKVIVVGAGAAGLMAAYAAACGGSDVTVIERNEKCGKKIYITGKGRCNLTNNCDIPEFFEHVVSNPRFLYSSLYGFTIEQTMRLFEDELGLRIKTERGNRVFPASDKSSDVISSLVKGLEKKGVKIVLNKKADKLLIEDGTIKGVSCNGEIYYADSVIIAAGGLSYPSTGSDGYGFKLAKMAGHTITKTYPSLVPLITEETWVKELMGLSLRNISVSFYKDGKKIYDDFGEMLFTHFGVSGPVILTASSYLAKRISDGNLTMYIDCKPALSEDELDRRILRDFSEQKNCHFSNSLGKLLPRKLIPVIVRLSRIKSDKPVNSVSVAERKGLVRLIKNLKLTITKTGGYNEAVITKGGIDVKEINPSTLESKLVKNLYFAGEIIDVDALTGGYNLQIAWSTGYTAGISIDK